MWGKRGLAISRHDCRDAYREKIIELRAARGIFVENDKRFKPSGVELAIGQTSRRGKVLTTMVDGWRVLVGRHPPVRIIHPRP